MYLLLRNTFLSWLMIHLVKQIPVYFLLKLCFPGKTLQPKTSPQNLKRSSLTYKGTRSTVSQEQQSLNCTAETQKGCISKQNRAKWKTEGLCVNFQPDLKDNSVTGREKGNRDWAEMLADNVIYVAAGTEKYQQKTNIGWGTWYLWVKGKCWKEKCWWMHYWEVQRKHMRNVQRNDNRCKKRLQGHEDLIVDLEAAAMLDSHGGINQNPTGTLLNQKWSHARQRQKNAHY